MEFKRWARFLTQLFGFTDKRRAKINRFICTPLSNFTTAFFDVKVISKTKRAIKMDEKLIHFLLKKRKVCGRRIFE